MWTPETRSRSHSDPRQRGRSGEWTRCGDELSESASPRSRSMSRHGRCGSPGARGEELWKARRQTKEECRILERTKNSLFREVTKGAQEMRLVGERLTKLLEPLHDVRCNMCVSEGSFPEKPSSNREDQVRIRAHLRREAAARDTRATKFDNTRLTKILKEGK